jgi:glyceraldehyde-3-phosphate dehydrogenase/erythrose-4-phosphate dehydrogenase
MKSVAINGYGTIGKRVADAVAAQDSVTNLSDTTSLVTSVTKPKFVHYIPCLSISCGLIVLVYFPYFYI